MTSKPRLLLFLGAGASMGFGKNMPDGKKLLRAVYNKIPDVAKQKDQHLIKHTLQALFPKCDKKSLLEIDYELVMTLMQRMREDPNGDLAALCYDPERAWGVLIAALGRAVHRQIHPKDYLNVNKEPQLAAFIRILEACYKECESVTLISMNYDILADKAVMRVTDHNLGIDRNNYQYSKACKNLSRSQYGVALLGEMKIVNGISKLLDKGFKPWKRLPKQIQLLKLHGSINWAYCPNCCEPKLEEESGVLGNFRADELKKVYSARTSRGTAIVCPRCKKGKIESLIVPPVHLKDIKQTVLKRIWSYAERALVDADRVVFIGYSLPPADPTVKELLVTSRAKKTNRDHVPWAYLIVNKCKNVHSTFRDLFGEPEISWPELYFVPTEFEQSRLKAILKRV
jgi:hypothetical protein